MERSLQTDEEEFYQRGNIRQDIMEQKNENRKWEHIYNWIRPHQALDYLAPMEFYMLWKDNPKKAYKIMEQYQTYLKKQRTGLAKSRKMKKKERVEKLMKHIEEKLNHSTGQNWKQKEEKFNQLSVNYVHGRAHSIDKKIYKTIIKKLHFNAREFLLFT